jgi:hypothetical protein
MYRLIVTLFRSLSIFLLCQLYIFITQLFWILDSDWSIMAFYGLLFLYSRPLLWITDFRMDAVLIVFASGSCITLLRFISQWLCHCTYAANVPMIYTPVMWNYQSCPWWAWPPSTWWRSQLLSDRSGSHSLRLWMVQLGQHLEKGQK